MAYDLQSLMARLSNSASNVNSPNLVSGANNIVDLLNKYSQNKDDKKRNDIMNLVAYNSLISNLETMNRLNKQNTVTNQDNSRTIPKNNTDSLDNITNNKEIIFNKNTENNINDNINSSIKGITRNNEDENNAYKSYLMSSLLPNAEGKIIPKETNNSIFSSKYAFENNENFKNLYNYDENTSYPTQEQIDQKLLDSFLNNNSNNTSLAKVSANDVNKLIYNSNSIENNDKYNDLVSKNFANPYYLNIANLSKMPPYNIPDTVKGIDKSSPTDIENNKELTLGTDLDTFTANNSLYKTLRDNDIDLDSVINHESLSSSDKIKLAKILNNFSLNKLNSDTTAIINNRLLLNSSNQRSGIDPKSKFYVTNFAISPNEYNKYASIINDKLGNTSLRYMNDKGRLLSLDDSKTKDIYMKDISYFNRLDKAYTNTKTNNDKDLIINHFKTTQGIISQAVKYAIINKKKDDLANTVSNNINPKIGIYSSIFALLLGSTSNDIRNSEVLGQYIYNLASNPNRRNKDIASLVINTDANGLTLLGNKKLDRTLINNAQALYEKLMPGETNKSEVSYNKVPIQIDKNKFQNIYSLDNYSTHILIKEAQKLLDKNLNKNVYTYTSNY